MASGEIAQPGSTQGVLRETFLERVRRRSRSDGEGFVDALRTVAKILEPFGGVPQGVPLSSEARRADVRAAVRDLVHVTRVLRGLYGEEVERPAWLIEAVDGLDEVIHFLGERVEEALE